MARFVINILAALMLVQFALAQAPNYCYPALCTDFKGVVYDHIACKQPPVSIY